MRTRSNLRLHVIAWLMIGAFMFWFSLARANGVKAEVSQARLDPFEELFSPVNEAHSSQELRRIGVEFFKENIPGSSSKEMKGVSVKSNTRGDAYYKIQYEEAERLVGEVKVSYRDAKIIYFGDYGNRNPFLDESKALLIAQDFLSRNKIEHPTKLNVSFLNQNPKLEMYEVSWENRAEDGTLCFNNRGVVVVDAHSGKIIGFDNGWPTEEQYPAKGVSRDAILTAVRSLTKRPETSIQIDCRIVSLAMLTPLSKSIKGKHTQKAWVARVLIENQGHNDTKKLVHHTYLFDFQKGRLLNKEPFKSITVAE